MGAARSALNRGVGFGIFRYLEVRTAALAAFELDIGRHDLLPRMKTSTVWKNDIRYE